MKTHVASTTVQDKEFLDKFNNETIINKFFDNSNQLHKENKFFNQKTLIDAKFKNEDHKLISKYAAKFNLFDDTGNHILLHFSFICRVNIVGI